MTKEYRTGEAAKNVEIYDNLDEEVDDFVVKPENQLSIDENHLNLNGKPFSAVHPAIRIKYYDEAPENFDQFGFRWKEGTDRINRPLEDELSRLKWIAHIQFKQNNLKENLTWDKLNDDPFNDQKTMDLIQEVGVPHSLRAFLWPRFCGATPRRKASTYRYVDISKEAEEEVMSASTQIERDLLRTLPDNRCFSKIDAPGVEALRRVLKSLAYFYPELGYCQGEGAVVGTLLLVCDEENCFWIMCKLIENFLPANFYGDNLIGLQAEVKLVEHLIEIHMPEVSVLLKNSDSDISVVIANWLLTLGAFVFPLKILLQIWDLLFQQGIVSFYRMLISMFKLNEEDILQMDFTEKPTAIFAYVQKLPNTITDINILIEHMASFQFSITEQTIVTLRKAHQGNIINECNIFNDDSKASFEVSQVTSRKLIKNKNIMENFFKSADESSDDPKTKNVRVTALIVSLRNSIYQVCDHFRNCPQAHKITIQASYDPQDVIKDRQEFKNARRKGQKHARALLDFEGQDKDELSFKKNDIITVLSEKDEHCWVGESDGCRGWFPAKFVQVVDERSKKYCSFGDEVLTPRIGHLVRNVLCSAIFSILNYGIRSLGIVSSSNTHAWHFIEASAAALMEAHNNVTHSKLTLCDTFNLDEDGKVLTPEELLFRAVHAILHSHTTKNIKEETKLRSLITFGLNEQCLHLWLDVLCDSRELDTLRKSYYHSWSFIRSPVWKQIVCELRLLAQFCFNLNIDFEVQQAIEIEELRKQDVKSRPKATMTSVGPSELRLAQNFGPGGQPLKEGVKDMLIKHHLFSWDL